MTEKELLQYRAIQARVTRNYKKVKELQSRDTEVVCGKVKGSSKHFPYTETRISVQMYEPLEMDKYRKRIKELEKLIREDEKLIGEIEFYICSIKDPELQNIFEMRIYDGMGWIDIALEMDEEKDRTTYSKKFKNYIQSSHNSPISQ